MKVIHRFKPEQFPIVITIYSKLGHELWSHVIEQPQGLTGVLIPGYGGSEHTPVRIVIDFADGTSEVA